MQVNRCREEKKGAGGENEKAEFERVEGERERKEE